MHPEASPDTVVPKLRLLRMFRPRSVYAPCYDVLLCDELASERDITPINRAIGAGFKCGGLVLVARNVYSSVGHISDYHPNISQIIKRRTQESADVAIRPWANVSGLGQKARVKVNRNSK